MYEVSNGFLLQGGEIGLVGRACQVAGFEIEAQLPNRNRRDDIATISPEDGHMAVIALHKMAERSFWKPGKGVRRLDTLNAQYILDHFFWAGHEPELPNVV